MRRGNIGCLAVIGVVLAIPLIASALEYRRVAKLCTEKTKLETTHCSGSNSPAAIEQRTGLALAESQRSAVALALAAKVVVVTGGPGVGKTTLVNAILRILSAKGGGLMRCAPTGRAAK